jgi:hypothetical protein
VTAHVKYSSGHDLGEDDAVGANQLRPAAFCIDAMAGLTGTVNVSQVCVAVFWIEYDAR